MKPVDIQFFLKVLYKKGYCCRKSERGEQRQKRKRLPNTRMNLLKKK
ncbi:hypothetical protein BAXH7_03585 [Bacillus amyloliquefaciens XH7]|nr:hypothetical protein LL3_03596 [Bacillus amyloliquefaciens LL3]AEK90697.1 hypothetical protein BAXH7_03585 [Bacillus amyloliquefaciens XH7]KYC99145.1 hypothetical protein B425_3615 [Bacillus amyloliquefaciens]